MIDTTQGMAQPERARFLKERFLSRRPSICLEGALAKTRAFRETEGEAPHRATGQGIQTALRNKDHRHRSP